MKIGRILALVSIIAVCGASYKYGPAVYHRAQARPGSKPEPAPAVKPVNGSISTNSAGIKLCNRDLGPVSLTNRFETCVSLGKGKQCRLTPLIIDDSTLQLTVTVESRNSNGRIHDLSITQVVAPEGKPLEVAAGDFNFCLTPNVIPKVTSQ